MGVDAKMLVRYRGTPLTEDQITRKAFELLSCIGREHFYIEDGLPKVQYKQAYQEWMAKMESHPKFVRDYYGNWQEIQEEIGKYPICRQRAFEPIKVYIQDGDPIYPSRGETFYDVSLSGRIYEIGYERGNLPIHCAIAEWLEQHLSPCEVWYGGDSSDMCAKLFNDSYRKSLRAHFYSEHGRDYFRSFSMSTLVGYPQPCSLCIPNEPRFSQFCWGGGMTKVRCQGCGKVFCTHDSGKTWEKEEDRE